MRPRFALARALALGTAVVLLLLSVVHDIGASYAVGPPRPPHVAQEGTLAGPPATTPPLVELRVEPTRLVAGRFDDGWLHAVAVYPRDARGWATLESHLAALRTAHGAPVLDIVPRTGARPRDLLAAVALAGRLDLHVRCDVERAIELIPVEI